MLLNPYILNPVKQWLSVSLLLGVLGLHPSLLAQTHSGQASRVQADEYDVRAALLLNLAKFIYIAEPDEASSQPYTVCVAGSDSLLQSFEKIFTNKRVHGNRIVLRSEEDLDEKSACRLLYIGPGKTTQVKSLLKKHSTQYTLTVSEYSEVSMKECMIVLRVVNDKLKIFISQSRIREAGLEVNAGLLNLAEDLDALEIL